MHTYTASDALRRTLLNDLGSELRQRHGLRSVVVVRDGRELLSAGKDNPIRTAEISADLTPDGWWYAWASDARTIAPADDVRGTASVVERVLRDQLVVLP